MSFSDTSQTFVVTSWKALHLAQQEFKLWDYIRGYIRKIHLLVGLLQSVHIRIYFLLFPLILLPGKVYVQ